MSRYVYLGDFVWNGKVRRPKYQYLIKQNLKNGRIVSVWREVTVNARKRTMEIKLADGDRHAQVSYDQILRYCHDTRQIGTLNQIRRQTEAEEDNTDLEEEVKRLRAKIAQLEELFGDRLKEHAEKESDND